MKELLQIQRLSGGYKKDVNILHDISLTVLQGESVGIIGLNGSGKSTFGKSIMGLIPYRYGVMEFDGEDVTGLSMAELSQRGISIMHQGGRVFDNLTIDENLKLAGKVDDEFRDLIPLLREGIGSRMADRLSGGQRHQLALAMTLLSHPRLVILDEPSAGLSPKAVEEMYQILTTVKQKMGVSIILIEQNISKAISFCDRSVLLAQGQISREFKGQNIKEIEEIMFNNKE